MNVKEVKNLIPVVVSSIKKTKVSGETEVFGCALTEIEIFDLIEEEGCDNEWLCVEVMKGKEVWYHANFPTIITRKNMLNTACAVSYLNWKYGETGNPCYFSWDKESKKIGVNLRSLVTAKTVTADVIANQIAIIADAYEHSALEIMFLLEGRQTGDDFVDDIVFPSIHWDNVPKENEIARMQENLNNARKAFEEEGKGIGTSKNTSLVRICVMGLDGKERQYPTLRLQLKEQKRTLTATHLLPYGSELEKGLDMAMAVLRINTKMEYGEFDFDLFHGRFVYRLSFDIADALVNKEKYKDIAEAVTRSFNKCYPLLAGYIKGTIPTRELISELEND